MNARVARIDTGAGASFIASAVIHLAVFFFLAWWGKHLPPQTAIQETYYVDVVTLPVADPRTAGSPQHPAEQEAVPVLATPPMKIPRLTKTVPRSIAKPVKPSNKAPSPQESVETESSFAERMVRLESNSEAQREEAVLEKLRSKVKSGSSSRGTPAVSGVEAGSRYADFIKSRLEDALKVTSSYSTKNPEVAVRLTITVDGKLSRMKIERSSGDVTFELAVRRAIDLASEKFTAPPNRSAFENGFVFKPKGISSAISR